MDCEYCKKSIQDGKFDSVNLPTLLESSNPGVVGVDTGHEFMSPKTRRMVRVVAKSGEAQDEAIARVRSNHGL